MYYYITNCIAQQAQYNINIEYECKIMNEDKVIKKNKNPLLFLYNSIEEINWSGEQKDIDCNKKGLNYTLSDNYSNIEYFHIVSQNDQLLDIKNIISRGFNNTNYNKGIFINIGENPGRMYF